MNSDNVRSGILARRRFQRNGLRFTVSNASFESSDSEPRERVDGTVVVPANTADQTDEIVVHRATNCRRELPTVSARTKPAPTDALAETMHWLRHSHEKFYHRDGPITISSGIETLLESAETSLFRTGLRCSDQNSDSTTVHLGCGQA